MISCIICDRPDISIHALLAESDANDRPHSYGV